ncbi:MAG: choice-of-anchor J domain-containing protein [Bacteroidales bacterium]|nr:choice-of-anchor J domain-containing protein [Bacteroidales bacterium]
MKKLYLLGIVLLAATFAFAQANTNAISKSLSSAKTIDKVPVNKHNVSLTKDAVLIQEFTSETFPPEGWDTIQGAESVDRQHWQRYAQDYNQDDHPCAGVQYANSDGTPRNQDEWLISPSFTVPANAMLSFDYFSNPGWFVQGWSSSFGGDYADINIKISTDDGANWVQIWNEDEYSAAVGGAEGFPQMRWSLITVDLSQYASQTVKIAFQYVGADAAFWYVDNVIVDAQSSIDFALTDAVAKMNPQYVNYGYNGQFANYPRREITQYSRVAFEGVVNNYGANPVTVKMVAKVFDPSNTQIFSYDFANVTIPAGTFDANGNFLAGVDTIVYYEPSAEDPDSYQVIEGSLFMMENMTVDGTYRFEISLEPVGFEYDNVNGRQLKHEFTTKITDDCLYSRDDNNYGNSTYDANDPNWHDFFAFGSTYQIFNPTDVLQSIEAYIADAEEGAEFYFAIFAEVNDAYQEVLATEHYIVGSDFQPGYLRLDSEDIFDLADVLTEEGSYMEIMAAVVVTNGKSLSVGVSEGTHEVFYENKAQNADNWYRITGTTGYLMIRLYTCEQEDPGIFVESFEANEIEMFPNPTTGIVNFSNVENATIEVFNMMGQVISRVDNANENATIDLSNVANGNYVVRIVKNGEVSTSKLNIAR